MRPRILPAGLLALLLAATACDAGGPEPADGDTWTLIRDRVFAEHCTQACHAAGTPMAQQSGLVLTADAAYGQLVDVPPTNAAARDAGLLRVDASRSVDLHRSFLWEKINAPEQDHFYEEHADYGSIMPLGGQALTYGELALIRQWILAGAPQTGVVADPVILADTARYRPASFEPLPALTPEEGVSLRLGPFQVPPETEREFFHYTEPVTAEDRMVDRIQITMRPGSHHFLAYTFAGSTPPDVRPVSGVDRDLYTPTGFNVSVLRQMAYHVFYGGTQWPRMDYRFPPGVALELPAGTAFDLNSHYVNRGHDPLQGEVHLNLHYADPTTVQHRARILVLDNRLINLPPGEVTTLRKSFSMPRTTHVFQLFSHAHRSMIEFRIERAGGARDGDLLYLTSDWAHPPILQLDPPLTLAPGEGLTLVATYLNATDRTIGWGFSADDEMMMAFGYYYTD